MGCRGEREICFASNCAKVCQKGTKSLKSKKLAIEVVAKRDVAGRLRTLATGLSLNSDKTWLLRRAQEFEYRAAMLERTTRARGRAKPPHMRRAPAPRNHS